jgi:hypothetical protein
MRFKGFGLTAAKASLRGLSVGCFRSNHCNRLLASQTKLRLAQTVMIFYDPHKISLNLITQPNFSSSLRLHLICF